VQSFTIASPSIKTNNLPSVNNYDKRYDNCFSNNNRLNDKPSKTSTQQKLSLIDSAEILTSSSSILLSSSPLELTRGTAEQIAGPFFGTSLFPYLAFLYFLNVPQNETPKGVTVGFATCLLFVFLTIPAAILAQLNFGVSLADCDWLHGSAESLLTVTNLVTVIAFRQALNAKNKQQEGGDIIMPQSAQSYKPMVVLVIILTLIASVTAFWPGLTGAEIHTPYLNGFMDIPKEYVFWGNEDPENSLSVACWIIHISSIVEFLVAMGFAWRWADVSNNPKWKGLTWGLIPLHSSGITACVYHLFYNSIPILVPIQAFLTCLGNTTAAYAAYRIAISNGWNIQSSSLSSFIPSSISSNDIFNNDSNNIEEITATTLTKQEEESSSLIGFEDLGDALSKDNDYTFLFKLFFDCAIASYVIKYGELLFDFPFDANIFLSFSVIGIPSALNAFKWYKRSQDPTFEGWF